MGMKALLRDRTLVFGKSGECSYHFSEGRGACKATATAWIPNGMDHYWLLCDEHKRPQYLARDQNPRSLKTLNAVDLREP
jgi:hypothetical protein